MSYELLCRYISPYGEGVHELSQRKRARLSQVDTKGGVCRGMTIDWLNYWKSWTGNFWGEDDKVPEAKGLLADQRMMQSAKVKQSLYTKENTGRNMMDEGTKESLSKSGLAFKEGDSLKSPHKGYHTDQWIIAKHVLNSGSRYFILSMGGEKKNSKKTTISHTIGFYRPWVLIGKNSMVYAFDPNFGEFKLNGERGIATFISGLNDIAYRLVNFDMNYYLWAFN